MFLYLLKCMKLPIRLFWQVLGFVKLVPETIKHQNIPQLFSDELWYDPCITFFVFILVYPSSLRKSVLLSLQSFKPLFLDLYSGDNVFWYSSKNSSFEKLFSWAIFTDLDLIPRDSDGKESACSVGDLSLIPGSGRSPGKGNDNPLQYFCLENSINRAAWELQFMGL